MKTDLLAELFYTLRRLRLLHGHPVPISGSTVRLAVKTIFSNAFSHLHECLVCEYAMPLDSQLAAKFDSKTFRCMHKIIEGFNAVERCGQLQEQGQHPVS